MLGMRFTPARPHVGRGAAPFGSGGPTDEDRQALGGSGQSQRRLLVISRPNGAPDSLEVCPHVGLRRATNWESITNASAQTIASPPHSLPALAGIEGFAKDTSPNPNARAAALAAEMRQPDARPADHSATRAIPSARAPSLCQPPARGWSTRGSDRVRSLAAICHARMSKGCRPAPRDPAVEAQSR